MTPVVDDPQSVRQVLADTDTLLLDFDGPVCSVFAGIPPIIVADQLRQVLTQGGHTTLPGYVLTSPDPFVVLRFACLLGADEAHHVEAAFTALEVEAIDAAVPTRGAHQLMADWSQTGRKLAIVSNNSEAAIVSYLSKFELGQLVTAVCARSTASLGMLKPNPFLLLRAIDEVGATGGRHCMIGDSESDAIAAHAAGSSFIAFANKRHKLSRFKAISSVSAIVSDIDVVAKLV